MIEEIECPWIVCEFNSENRVDKSGKCLFTGKIQLIAVVDPDDDDQDLHEECMACATYRPNRDKVILHGDNTNTDERQESNG